MRTNLIMSFTARQKKRTQESANWKDNEHYNNKHRKQKLLLQTNNNNHYAHIESSKTKNIVKISQSNADFLFFCVQHSIRKEWKKSATTDYNAAERKNSCLLWKQSEQCCNLKLVYVYFGRAESERIMHYSIIIRRQLISHSCILHSTRRPTYECQCVCGSPCVCMCVFSCVWMGKFNTFLVSFRFITESIC